MKKSKLTFLEKFLLKRILIKTRTPDIKDKYNLHGNIFNYLLEECKGENKKINLTYNEIELLYYMYENFAYKLSKTLAKSSPYYKKATESQKHNYMEAEFLVQNIYLRMNVLRELIREYDYVCPNCGYSTDDYEIKYCIKCGTQLDKGDIRHDTIQ